ncbi:oxidoreductase, aldo/keto reductase family protein [Histomonas meleagridis]|uniref:oxidoreductase, aldo/keto reductase family protein n=1 Tax=Histomonas meleagridis TaxID=135588 RepID=UPI003559C016|nr:oxidoreductase, aldo/keto reductase family protein [Histomonas meleagridis]
MQEIPKVGFGTWSVPESEVVENAVKEAIKAGYRHIDCAFSYQNEASVGRAIKEMIDTGVVKREELWITSKLWSTHHDPAHVEESIRKSLKDLQLEYLDLFLVHQPLSFEYSPDDLFPKDESGKIKIVDIPMVDTWKAMEQLVEKGLTRHIGMCNVSIELIEKIRFTPGIKIQPYAIQCECHPYLQNDALIEYLEKRGIHFTCYSPLGSPGNVKQGVFQDDKQKPKILLEDPVVNEIAKELGRTPAQVILKFLTQLSPMVSVVPKSMTPSRIRENFQLDFELSKEQFQKMKNLNCYGRIFWFQKMFGTEFYGDGY